MLSNAVLNCVCQTCCRDVFCILAQRSTQHKATCCLYSKLDLLQDDGHISGAVEKQIFETLAKIRKRDRSIYDSSQHFFADAAASVSEDHEQQDKAAKKTKKPMYLKDVIAQQVQQLTSQHNIKPSPRRKYCKHCTILVHHALVYLPCKLLMNVLQ